MNLVPGTKGLMKTPWTSQGRVNWEETTEKSKEVGGCLRSKVLFASNGKIFYTQGETIYHKGTGMGHTELGAGLVLSPGNRAGT